MTQENGLLPCPFCGDVEQLLIVHDPKTILHPHFHVYCDNCGARSGGSDLGNHVEEWNTRTPIVHASGDAIAFCKWVMDNYDDNGFEELYNRAKAVVDNSIPAAEIDEALKALNLCHDIDGGVNKRKIRSVLNKMRGV